MLCGRGGRLLRRRGGGRGRIDYFGFTFLVSLGLVWGVGVMIGLGCWFFVCLVWFCLVLSCLLGGFGFSVLGVGCCPIP